MSGVYDFFYYRQSVGEDRSKQPEAMPWASLQGVA